MTRRVRLVAACLGASLAAASLTAQSGRGVPQPRPRLGSFHPTAEAVLLAADRLAADRWYATGPRGMLTSRLPPIFQPYSSDQQLVWAATGAPDPAIRRIAIRAIGRFETPENVVALAAALSDREAPVRAEAARAIVQSFIAEDAAASDFLDDAKRALEARMALEQDARVSREIFLALAALPQTPAQSLRLERFFLSQLHTTPQDRDAALAGLVELFRLHKGRPIGGDTLDALRAWAMTGLEAGSLRVELIRGEGMGPTSGFVEALSEAHDGDLEWPERAATFQCADSAVPECGLEIRIMGVRALNPRAFRHREVLKSLAYEERTRLAALKRLAVARLADAFVLEGTDGACAALFLAETVVTAELLDAIGRMKDDCQPGARRQFLMTRAAPLIESIQPGTWGVPLRALQALAVQHRDDALKLATQMALPHPLWQVRAAAASLAGVVNAPELAEALADDPQPNVRTAALVALQSLGSRSLAVWALKALESDDYNLVRAAQAALADPPDRLRAIDAMFLALGGLTKNPTDTSRHPRLAILDRLSLLIRPADQTATLRREQLAAMFGDFDPLVARRAGAVYTQVTGDKFPPVKPTRRPPMQPSEREIRDTPPCLVLNVGNRGEIVVLLDTMNAPVASAMAAKLARGGYFDGQMIYRDAVDVLEGGSPGANDYSGHDRFMRDEIGARHDAATIGLSTHGRDTADARFFINKLPRHVLDRRATVFGSILPDSIPIETIQNGDVVTRITAGLAAPKLCQKTGGTSGG